MSTSILRLVSSAAVATRPLSVLRTATIPRAVVSRYAAPSATLGVRGYSSAHDEETFEEFTARYEKEFDGVQDVFELQRNLNNCFAYDLVPSTSVIEAALRAARRVNDFPTAVRIFEGIRAKVENNIQYEQYLSELKPLREELGVQLAEELYPPAAKK
ncbi:Cytochrome c oxidase subunit 6 [Orbilia oligospora]|uniref:Cytochrome c oxidase subunit 6, mitochondrial n=1 Tax=Orbilia oligospora TaxID=2813651 RepID=A0A4Z0WZU3_ORBOL|nr:Cytochrome c oxidase subunit 6 [Orbilia oligospora]KAF3090841.1 Cytochrome c oxidase subunit 6 [Orbilia oligospora]KAF3100857.1 Cytochrome c oxidase subunit 6 [Orbilia oligospora]KAF3143714.1 Cytochrome c oxidase subunit 6 [Orbilia oligospora]KAF3149995.1 Cytochrome c oxidase subunit 6 [Orbilia oligospora]